MLTRLQAEERLAAIDVALLGAGGFEPQDARRMLDGLRAQVDGVQRPRAQKANGQMLGGMGIGVTVIEPSKAAGDG